MEIYPKMGNRGGRGGFIWPFTIMEIGDTVRIAAVHKNQAKSAVWSCTNGDRGYFFAITKDKPTGDLIITRTAEKPPPLDPNASWWATRKEDKLYMLLSGEQP